MRNFIQESFVLPVNILETTPSRRKLECRKANNKMCLNRKSDIFHPLRNWRKVDVSIHLKMCVCVGGGGGREKNGFTT